MHNDLLLELLENPSFIDWVNSDFEKNDEEWSPFIDKHPDDHDTINEAIRLTQQLKGDHFLYPDKLRLLQRIEKSSGIRAEKPQTFTLIRFSRYIGYAASFFILLSAVLYLWGNKSVQTGIGEQLVVYLPDESEVTLNTNSSLTYNKVFWNFGRKVTLAGEAFFKVTKGEKFTVSTQQGDIKVLGTSFNVRVGKNESLDVFCYTGRVAVNNKTTSTSAVLTKGQGIKTSKNQSQPQEKYTSGESSPGWKSGRESFHNASLYEVAEVLQNYFPYQIKMDGDLATIKITADVSVTNLDSALQNITWPLELQYKVKEKVVTIYR